ncbi:MAG: hypothetical protein V1736_00200 [Pseudomonadota bacterium]
MDYPVLVRPLIEFSHGCAGKGKCEDKDQDPFFGGHSRTLPCPKDIDFQIKLLGALSVGDVRTGTIPSLLPSQKHYLKV